MFILLCITESALYMEARQVGFTCQAGTGEVRRGARSTQKAQSIKCLITAQSAVGMARGSSSPGWRAGTVLTIVTTRVFYSRWNITLTQLPRSPIRASSGGRLEYFCDVLELNLFLKSTVAHSIWESLGEIHSFVFKLTPQPSNSLLVVVSSDQSSYQESTQTKLRVQLLYLGLQQILKSHCLLSSVSVKQLVNC